MSHAELSASIKREHGKRFHTLGRSTIVTVYGAPPQLIDSLETDWVTCTLEKALDKLSSPDVTVARKPRYARAPAAERTSGGASGPAEARPNSWTR